MVLLWNCEEDSIVNEQNENTQKFEEYDQATYIKDSIEIENAFKSNKKQKNISKFNEKHFLLSKSYNGDRSIALDEVVVYGNKRKIRKYYGKVELNVCGFYIRGLYNFMNRGRNIKQLIGRIDIYSPKGTRTGFSFFTFLFKGDREFTMYTPSGGYQYGRTNYKVKNGSFNRMVKEGLPKEIIYWLPGAIAYYATSDVPDPVPSNPFYCSTYKPDCKYDEKYDIRTNTCVKKENDESSDDDKIDDNGLNGKAECLNNHLDKKGNSFVKNILKKFQGNSEFDIKIVSKDKVFPKNITTSNGINGKTIYVKGSSLINIEISTSKLSNMPALAAARTLIHEYIHADMYRKLHTKYPTEGDLDFKKTYLQFKKGNFKATPQHNSMADLYVHSMRDALKSFHKKVLVGDYNYLTNNGTNPLPDSFYEALAWQGLKDDNVKAYANLTNAKKTELTNALNAHYHSTTKNCPK